MSESKVGAFANTTQKPIILLTSRDLTKAEMLAMHRFLNVFEFNPDVHMDKVLKLLPYEMCILNLNSQRTRNYWGTQLMDFRNDSDVIVWCRAPSDEATESTLTSLNYKYSVKTIRSDATTKEQLINSLKSVHVPKIIGRGKKFFKTLLGCLFSSLSK